MEQCSGVFQEKNSHPHDSCEMIYLGVTFGKLKLPAKHWPRYSRGVPPYNFWRQIQCFECPVCKSSRLVETEFWINRKGCKHNDNEEFVGMVDKWKPWKL